MFISQFDQVGLFSESVCGGLPSACDEVLVREEGVGVGEVVCLWWYIGI